MLGYLVLALLVTKIVYVINGVKNVNYLSDPIYKFTRFIVSTWAKIFMFGFGIKYNEEEIDIDDSKYTKVKRADISNINESIIVSNHVCFFDFFPFFAYYNACTIAKSMVKSIPIISFGAKIA